MRLRDIYSLDVYIIHLPSHVERRRHIESLMKRIGFPSFEFVTPETIPENERNSRVNRPTRSLYETNIALMERLSEAESTAPYVLIFEDDVVPTVPAEDVRKVIERTMAVLPDDWDMLYLEYCCETCLMAKTVAPGLIQSRNPSCTAAIMYRRERLAKILPLIKRYRREKQIDHAYKHLIQQGALKAYSAYPAVFRQDTNTFASTLDTFYIKRFLFGYSSCDTKMWVSIGATLAATAGMLWFLRAKRLKTT